MSLSDRLEAEATRPSDKCYTCAAFENLSDEEISEIEAYYESPNYTRASVWRAVRDEYNLKFSDSAFHNHFRRGHGKGD